VAVWLLYFPSMVFALLWKGRRLMAVVTAAAVLLNMVGIWLSRAGQADLVRGTQMIGVTL
jgi:hypothetical protein